MSVKVDEEDLEELDRLARRYGKTRSELIRHAIRRLVLEDQSGSGEQGSSGPGPLGTSTGTR